MAIRSQGPKGQGSETRTKVRTRQVVGKRQAPLLGEEIVRSAWKRAAVQEVFEEGYEKHTDGCWHWLKGKSHGYGQMRVHQVFGSTPLYAHRVSYVLYHGPIPEGLSVLHRCDNHYCVNPEHLFHGTQQDNLADMVGKKRHPYGQRNGQAKVSDLVVLAIREAVASGEKQYLVARLHNLSEAQISRIVRGRQRGSASGAIRKKHGNFKHGLYTNE